MPTLYQIVTIALLSAFIIQLISKLGARDYVIENSGYIISNAFSCDFCISFWVNLCVCAILAIITANFVLLFIPFLSTPITRILL